MKSDFPECACGCPAGSPTCSGNFVFNEITCNCDCPITCESFEPDFDAETCSCSCNPDNNPCPPSDPVLNFLCMCTCPAFEAAGFDELQATINCQIENDSAAYVFERETCSCVYTPPTRIFFGFSGCGLYSTLETDHTYPAYDYRI